MLCKHPRSMPLRCSIDVSAFVSVMMALLWMFMAVHTPHYPYPPPSFPVDLAKTSYSVPMKGALREDAILVSINRSGRIFFDGSQVSPKDLRTRIKDRVNAGAPLPVYLKVDARAHYRTVAAVVDGIHDAGIEKIGLITERPGTSQEIVSR